jgi:D-3-phosphoglycerate dehydrogenase
VRGKRFHVLIVGDDFTPADLFRRVLEPALLESGLQPSFDLFDQTDAAYHAEEAEGIREFYGDPHCLIERVKDADVLIVTFAPVTETVLASGSHLRVVGCGRGGPVNVDVKAATRHGIPVVYAPGRNAEAVAEFTLGLLITLARRILDADSFVRSGLWRDGREDTFAKPTGPELGGRTLGIIGLGAVGIRLVELVKPLHMRVLAADPFLTTAQVRERGAEPVPLPELLREADYVSVHARLAPGSPPLVGEAELAWMKPTAYLINTSRGGALDEAALVRALRARRLAGAALDVFSTEPLPLDHPFVHMEHTILTPHVAGISEDVPLRTAEIIATEVTAVVRGEHPRFLRNPEVLSAGI